MKKVISFITAMLTMMMFLSVCLVESNAIDSSKYVLTIDSVTCLDSEEVIVPVCMSSVPGMDALTLQIEYDRDIMCYSSFKQGDICSGFSVTESTDGVLKIMYSEFRGIGRFNKKRTVVYLVFKVNESGSYTTKLKVDEYDPEYNEENIENPVINIGTIKINETFYAEKVRFENESLLLTRGDTTKLNCAVLPSNTTDKTLKWSTSDFKIVSVDYEGNVVAVSPGTATVKAVTPNDVSASIEIKVREKSPDPVIYTDPGSGVQVETTLGVIPIDANFIVMSHSFEDEYSCMISAFNKLNAKLSGNIEFYSVAVIDKNGNRLSFSNGQPIQPNGQIKIRIPVKSNWDLSNLRAFEIRKGEGRRFEDVDVVDVNGVKYAQIKTDRLGYYAICDKELDECACRQICCGCRNADHCGCCVDRCNYCGEDCVCGCENCCCMSPSYCCVAPPEECCNGNYVKSGDIDGIGLTLKEVQMCTLISVGIASALYLALKRRVTVK